MFDVFYRGNPCGLFPHEQPAESLESAAAQSRTAFFWYLDSRNDYSSFDFGWLPPKWEKDHIHVFPSQWQKDGGTFFAPKNIHTESARNYRDQTILRKNESDVVFLDHGNPESVARLKYLEGLGLDVTHTRFIGSYLETLKRVVRRATSDRLWVVSSLCDYTNFDFSWHPSPWQETMLHVFPSNDQACGDTFYVNVPEFGSRSADIQLLDWYDTINYCADQKVPRDPSPVVLYQGDSLATSVEQHQFTSPYTTFSDRPCEISYTPKLWSVKDRAIHSFNASNGILQIPREIKQHFVSQLYDYPYIVRHKGKFFNDIPLDIVYVSNGETGAETWWENLLSRTRGHNNRVIRIDGVQGRTQALRAAAESSRTSWFFVVPAKLEVLDTVDWNWQPDLLQIPKHYIFYARNPVNGLEYGHMGMVAYNRRLVLETTDPGLDFTMSRAHDVVPVVVGIAHFNADPPMTWRTAFREVIKLKDSIGNKQDVEAAYRLEKWLTVARGENAEWSLRGSRDAVDYYEEVGGDYSKLLLSYDWAWLKTRFDTLYQTA